MHYCRTVRTVRWTDGADGSAFQRPARCLAPVPGLVGTVGLLPTAISSQIWDVMAYKVRMSVSNVPGPPADTKVCGANPNGSARSAFDRPTWIRFTRHSP